MKALVQFSMIILSFLIQCQISYGHAPDNSKQKFTYYHTTLNRNLHSILKNGLDPNFGGTGAGAGIDRILQIPQKTKSTLRIALQLLIIMATY